MHTPCLIAAILLGTHGAGALHAAPRTLELFERDPQTGVIYAIRELDREVPERFRPSSPLAQSDSSAVPDTGWEVGASIQIDTDLPGEGSYNQSPVLRWREDGLLACVWMQNHSGYYSDVMYSQSSDGGWTWSAPESVSEVPSGMNIYPTLEFTPSGKAIVVWDLQPDDFSSYRTCMRQRSPGPEPGDWGATQVIQTSYANAGDIQSPNLVVLDEMRFLVAWADYHLGPRPHIYFRRTDDGGVSWSEDVRVSPSGSRAVEPTMVVDVAERGPRTETIYIACSDWRGQDPFADVRCHRSTDGGRTWGGDVRVNHVTPGPQQTYRGCLGQSSDGTLTVAWNHLYEDENILVAQSFDGGASWGETFRINESAPGAGVGLIPTVTVRGTRIIVGYEWQREERHAYARISDSPGAALFGPRVRLSRPEETDLASEPATATDGDVFFACWSDYAVLGSGMLMGARVVPSAASSVPANGSEASAVLWVAEPSVVRAGGTVVLRQTATWGLDWSGSGETGWRGEYSVAFHDLLGRQIARIPAGAGTRAHLTGSEIRVPDVAGVYLLRVDRRGERSAAVKVVVVR